MRRADRDPGFAAAITGEFTLDGDLSTLAGDDLREGELGFGLPAALIVLLLVFGSVVAGLIPLLLSLVSITVALALTALVGQAFPLSVFATNMLTGMGLALGIDYSLFILSRYREERRAAASPATRSPPPAPRPAERCYSAASRSRSRCSGCCSSRARSCAASPPARSPPASPRWPRRSRSLPALLGLLGDRVDALRIPLIGRSAAPAGEPRSGARSSAV